MSEIANEVKLIQALALRRDDLENSLDLEKANNKFHLLEGLSFVKDKKLYHLSADTLHIVFDRNMLVGYRPLLDAFYAVCLDDMNKMGCKRDDKILGDGYIRHGREQDHPRAIENAKAVFKRDPEFLGLFIREIGMKLHK